MNSYQIRRDSQPSLGKDCVDIILHKMCYYFLQFKYWKIYHQYTHMQFIFKSKGYGAEVQWEKKNVGNHQRSKSPSTTQKGPSLSRQGPAEALTCTAKISVRNPDFGRLTEKVISYFWSSEASLSNYLVQLQIISKETNSGVTRGSLEP